MPIKDFLEIAVGFIANQEGGGKGDTTHRHTCKVTHTVSGGTTWALMRGNATGSVQEGAVDSAQATSPRALTQSANNRMGH